MTRIESKSLKVPTRLLLTLLTMAAMALTVKGADFPFQECAYSIDCHCAFIHETAAHATIQFSCYDDTYNATLAGCSIPIFGTMYCVNDTLQARYIPSGQTISPASESVLYLSGYYRKPHEGDVTFAESPSSYRSISGAGSLSADPSTMECVSLTADMLCMFYYAKTVDFDRMEQGIPQEVPITMPDGSNCTLQLIYNGECDYQGHNAYNLTANFTYGGTLSRYPITVMIDSELRIPVEFVANIDIGEVIMAYDY